MLNKNFFYMNQQSVNFAPGIIFKQIFTTQQISNTDKQIS